jgi:hypothetical protein
MTVFKDDGGGVTEISLKYFAQVSKRVCGRFVRAEASFDPLVSELGRDGFRHEYNLILVDDCGNQVWLSGCNCGYGGTGPWGTFEVLKQAGIFHKDADFADTRIGSSKHLSWTIPLEAT